MLGEIEAAFWHNSLRKSSKQQCKCYLDWGDICFLRGDSIQMLRDKGLFFGQSNTTISQVWAFLPFSYFFLKKAW